MARAAARRSSFTIRAPIAELPPTRQPRFHRRAAGTAGPPRAGRRRQRHQSPRAEPADGQVGHAVRRDTRICRRDALRWLEAGETFDLAILDMHMPGMDGIELARRMRAIAAGRMPLVLFSSLGRREAGDTKVCSAPTWPNRCGSPSSSTRWSSLLAQLRDAQGHAPQRRTRSRRSTPRWACATRCASWSRKTTS